MDLTTTTATPDLLGELCHLDITAFAHHLHAKLPELLAPLQWLMRHATSLLVPLSVEAQSFLSWCWEYRHTLHLQLATDIPPRGNQ